MRRTLDQPSSGEFAPAVSATRRCHAPVQANGYVAEIHVGARLYSQPLQSRTPSHRPRHLQDPALRVHGGMEESCKLTSANAGFPGVDSVTLTVPAGPIRSLLYPRLCGVGCLAPTRTGGDHEYRAALASFRSFCRISRHVLPGARGTAGNYPLSGLY